MTKNLQKILEIDTDTAPQETEDEFDAMLDQPQVLTAVPIEPAKLKEQLDEYDKITAALPKVKGLGDISDQEFDNLAAKAEEAFDNLMDIGFNITPQIGVRLFEVASNMMNAAITAKSAKIDKKLKMIDLQLKKLAIDKKHADPDALPSNTAQGEGYIITDRNSILEKLKNMK